MSIHILLHALLIVGVVLVFVWLWRPPGGGAEAFAAQTPEEETINKFHYQLFADPPTASSTTGKQVIPINPGVLGSLTDLDKTVEGASIFGPLFKDNFISKFFYERRDPAKESDETCQYAGHPRNLGNTGLEEGCGWWFVEDPAVPSTAAFGTPEGPAESVLQGRLLDRHPGGVWIWDLAEAGKREDMKRCRQIRTCAFVKDGDLGVQCGYCPDLGYAVPINDQGLPKYPHDAAANCGSDALVVDPTKCPAPRFVPRLIGVDYQYDLNGNVVRSPDTDARLAYEEGGQVLEDTCKPATDTGFVTRDCLKALATSAGCQPTGGILRLLASEKPAYTETDRIALSVLEKKGALIIPNTFWRAAVSREEAVTMLSNLYTLSIAAPSLIAKDAAQWMVRGGDFDVCYYKDTDRNTVETPFRIECIQREFRKAGCQPTGTDYPRATQLEQEYKDLTMADLKTRFRDLHDAMQLTQTTSIRAQDEAVRKCLGIQVARVSDEALLEAQPNLCRQKGILYEVFEVPATGTAPSPTPGALQPATGPTTPRIFLGSFVSSRGFEVSDRLRELFGKVRVGKRGMYVARTVFVAATDATLTVSGSSGYTLKADGHPVTTGSIQATAMKPVSVEVVFVEPQARAVGSAAALRGPTVTGQGMLQRLYLPYEAWRPVVDLRVDSYVGPLSEKVFRDVNGLLDLTELQLADAKGRQGARLSASPLVSGGGTGFLHSVLKTITCMVNPSSITNQVTLFRFDEGAEGSSGSYITLQLLERRPVLTLYQGKEGMITMQGTRAIENTDLNTWIHFVVHVGTGVDELRMFVNGVDVTPSNVLSGPGSGGKIQARGTLRGDVTYSRVSLGSRGFLGLVGWFHVYTRRLDATRGLERDRRYDDVTYQANFDVTESVVGSPGPTGS